MLMILPANFKNYSDSNYRIPVVQRVLKLFSFLSSKKFLITSILKDLYLNLRTKLFQILRFRYLLHIQKKAKTTTLRKPIF